MLLKSYVKILIILFVFGGCKSSKIQIEQIDKDGFCQITNQLIERLKKDKEFRKHFYIEDEILKIYLDTMVEKGIPFFFQLKVADIISKKDSIPVQEAYSKMYDELTTKENSKIIYKTDCLKEQLKLEDAEIRIRFFYSKNYNLLALDATTILKEPGYLLGYLYLVEIEKNGKYKDVTKTSWTQ